MMIISIIMLIMMIRMIRIWGWMIRSHMKVCWSHEVEQRCCCSGRSPHPGNIWCFLLFFCHLFTFLWLSKRFCNSSFCWSICSKFWMCLVDVSEATEAWRQWGVEYFVSQCFTIPCWILCFATCNGAFPILPPVCRTNSQTHLWTNNAFITIPINTLGTS